MLVDLREQIPYRIADRTQTVGTFGERERGVICAVCRQVVRREDVEMRTVR